MSKIIRALQFARITDVNNNLSLTNLTLATVLCHAWLSSFSLADVGALVVAIAAYQFHQHAAAAHQAPADVVADLQEKLSQLNDKVTGVQIAAGMRVKS